MCYKYTIFDNFLDNPLTCRNGVAIKIIANPTICDRAVNVYDTWCYTYIISLFISSSCKAFIVASGHTNNLFGSDRPFGLTGHSNWFFMLVLDWASLIQVKDYLAHFHQLFIRIYMCANQLQLFLFFFSFWELRSKGDINLWIFNFNWENNYH